VEEHTSSFSYIIPFGDGIDHYLRYREEIGIFKGLD